MPVCVCVRVRVVCVRVVRVRVVRVVRVRVRVVCVCVGFVCRLVLLFVFTSATERSSLTKKQNIRNLLTDLFPDKLAPRTGLGMDIEVRP